MNTETRSRVIGSIILILAVLALESGITLLQTLAIIYAWFIIVVAIIVSVGVTSVSFTLRLDLIYPKVVDKYIRSVTNASRSLATAYGILYAVMIILMTWTLYTNGFELTAYTYLTVHAITTYVIVPFSIDWLLKRNKDYTINHEDYI